MHLFQPRDTLAAIPALATFGGYCGLFEVTRHQELYSITAAPTLPATFQIPIAVALCRIATDKTRIPSALAAAEP